VTHNEAAALHAEIVALERAALSLAHRIGKSSDCDTTDSARAWSMARAECRLDEAAGLISRAGISLAGEFDLPPVADREVTP